MGQSDYFVVRMTVFDVYTCKQKDQNIVSLQNSVLFFVSFEFAILYLYPPDRASSLTI